MGRALLFGHGVFTPGASGAGAGDSSFIRGVALAAPPNPPVLCRRPRPSWILHKHKGTENHARTYTA